jgi:hypothetical protein
MATMGGRLAGAAQWRVGKGEIAVERRSRGPTSDSRAPRRICDAEYFCDTNLACRRGRSCPNRVKDGCGQQAYGTAGLPPAPEMHVRSGTCASCQGDIAGVPFASRCDGSDRPLDVFQLQTPLRSDVGEDVELVPANCADNPLQGLGPAHVGGRQHRAARPPSAIGLSDQPVCSNCI